MANIETINVGLAPNDKKGDPLRDAMQKVNLNFTTLNAAIRGVVDGKGQANGYASLGGDGRLLAAQAPIVYSAALPTTAHDLNNYITPGTFYQTTIAGATAPNGVNYPVAMVGFLEVVATGTPVLQTYTTRVGGIVSQRFWRVRISTASWSSWKEEADTSTALTYQGGMPTAQDLNNYTQRGMWAIGSSAAATGGTNFPIGNSGTLVVFSAGYPGGSAATNVSQLYLAANTNRVFYRSFISPVWTAWEEVVRSSLIGAANGVGSLDATGRSPVAQFPLSVAVVSGTDANTLISPGVYYTNSDAQATAVLNWPMQLAGTLLVEAAAAGNSQITQTYTTRNGTGGVLRTYKRVRFGTGGGTWGSWQELARYDDAMTHVYLGAAGVDCNTLIADNTYYTIDLAATVTSGSNWPPTTSIIGGSVEVRRQAASRVHQTVTLLVGSNQKPRIFYRFGDPTSNSWQNWTMISSVSQTGWLPTANCGDVYVDGLGWHKWNGTAYELTSLAPTLPTAAHDLNTYQTPGSYFQSSAAGAVAGSNYPAPVGGFLTVSQAASGSGTIQEYTLRSSSALSMTSGPRKFWRSRDVGNWSPWQEVLSSALGMTHTFLTAAVDANTLTADNTYYTWASAAVAAGSNFPGYQAGGYMQVFWLSATIVCQELSLIVAGGKPMKFARYGNTSTGGWQPWKVTGAFNSAAWMPSSDMGEISVDSRGVYRWNAATSSYLQAPPTPVHREGLKTVWAGFTTITVNPGRCASVGGEVLLELLGASTRTLQTSGAFVHGASGNGLLTGARTANYWYYVFLLRRDSDGAVCVAFDTSVTCANRPSTHSHYRRVGCVLTDSSNNLWAFVQYGNEFWFDVKMVVFNGSTLVANTTYTPNTYTPPNVAHTIRFCGFLGTLGGVNASLLAQYRQGSRLSEWTYTLIASPAMNTVNDWEIPMQAVAAPTVNFQSPNNSCTANVYIKGYVDLFED